jgi:membrane protein DedA with SNARE-associated domain
VRERLADLLEWLLEAKEALVYLVLALLAALENVVPPIPADVVIAFGGFLAARREMSLVNVFVVVWLANVAGALFVYAMGRRYGPVFFRSRVGSLILQPEQLVRLDAVYRRYGLVVIFVSRFLPMLRSVVPAFAGIIHLGVWRTSIPLAAASAIWYGMIIYFAALAGEHWERVVEALTAAGRWLGVLAALIVGALGWWWWRSRQRHE